MPLTRSAIAMAVFEIRVRVGDDLGDVLNGEQLQLIVRIVREAIEHQNVPDERLTGY